jgi:EpsI family protein
VPELPFDQRASDRRVFITASLLVGGFALVHGVSHGERIPARQPLRQFPLVLDGWRGQEWPIEQQVLAVLGVTDYLSRLYTDATGHAVGLYIGYYASQRTGDTIHSPKNCLPGSGWEPVHSARLTINLPSGASMVVNEYLIEKGSERQLVLYWYQGRGRVVASEYSGKVWMVVDAIKRNRTDGALVRAVTSTRDGEAQARRRAVGFVEALAPRLSEFIPD